MVLYQVPLCLRTKLFLPVHAKARENILRSQARMERQYNARAKPHDFKVADIVYLNQPTFVRPQLSQKLAPMYKGPFQVIRLLGQHNCKLRSLPNGKILKKAINVSRLRLARLRGPVDAWLPDFSDFQDSQDDSDTDTPDTPALANPPTSDIPPSSVDHDPQTSQARPVPTPTPLPTPPNHSQGPPGKQENTVEPVTGSTVPSLAIPQARLAPGDLYFPVEILRAAYVDKQLRIEVKADNLPACWVPIRMLNQAAVSSQATRNRFYSLQLKIENVPALRNRLAT